MRIKAFCTPKQLGEAAADYTASVLNHAIEEKGTARIVLSTGASQFDTIDALVKKEVDWSCVEMFHLDEYVDLPETHPASFRKYLKERFISKVNLKAAHMVQDKADCIGMLTKEIRKSPIDIGLIGIGENAHIAFNDPPADFETKDAYKVVNLNETCKKQQVGEGWFLTVDDVPKQAITMTVFQIMQCKTILSCVPYAVKAKAVKLVLENTKTNEIPATIMKEHKDFSLFLDADSSAMICEEKIIAAEGNEDFSFEII